jgi:hypothetical protein
MWVRLRLLYEELMRLQPLNFGLFGWKISIYTFLCCSTLYSCAYPAATYISLDANSETLVVKSVQSERPIWGWGTLNGHSSNMYSAFGIKWYVRVRGNRSCANWDIQTCISSLEYSAALASARIIMRLRPRITDSDCTKVSFFKHHLTQSS